MIAAVILDLSVLVAAMATAVVVVTMTIRKQFGAFSVRAGSMEAKLTAMSQSVEQINTAVNHVPAGTPTLVSRVAETEKRMERMEEHQHWERRALQGIATHVGVEVLDFEAGTRSQQREGNK